MKKALNKLTSDDYQEGYELSLTNGKKHISCATLLSENEEYGFAISHLILGSEELIKALILLYKSSDNSFYSEKIDEIFKYHGTKHELFKEMLQVFSNDFFNNWLQNIQNKMYGLNSKNKKGVKDSKFVDVGLFVPTIYPEAKIEENELTFFLNFFKGGKESLANKEKNNGLYVRYNKKWYTPQEFKLEDFLKIQKIVNWFLFVIQKFNELQEFNMKLKGMKQ